MPLTRKARAAADAAALSAAKAEARGRLEALANSFSPALSSSELASLLEVEPLEVGRWLSEAPRNRRSRPDTGVRALVEELLAGRLLVAVGPQRELLVCEPSDASWVEWELRNLAGGAVPARKPAARDWEDDALWEVFGSEPAPSVHFLGVEIPPLGLGGMRLSTEGRPPPEEALALLRRAADLGLRLVDTADVYCLSEEELGHNERLIRQSGAPLLPITKCGLARPGGRWVPDARPERLRRSVEASLANLGLEALPLVQLHGVDPKVPLEESLGALHRLREAGLIRAVGACNLDSEQLERALAAGPLASLQVPLSLFERGNLALLRRCRQLGIPLLAHSPLGGHKRRGKSPPEAIPIAERHGVSPQRVALAWLIERGAIPLVGSTRVGSLADSVGALRLRLDTRDAMPREAPADAHIQVIMGPPAAGKTSIVQDWVDRGYLRLNRDELGGRLDDLVPRLAAALDAGQRRFVLDNTYASRRSRAALLKLAQERGIPAHALVLQTSHRDAMLNAAGRIIEKTGQLLDPDEIKRHPGPNVLPPQAIRRWFDEHEPPTGEEGFAAVEHRPFERRPASGRGAILLDLDGTIRHSLGKAPFPRHPDEVALLPNRREKLHALRAEGWLLLGVSNQSGIASGDVSEAQVRACNQRTEELLGLEMDIRFCPHTFKGPVCWCRKPLPGMGLLLARDYGLDLGLCTMVGDRDSDREFAHNMGSSYVDAEEFFKP